MPNPSSWRPAWWRWVARTRDAEPPLRAELYSVDQLARHARELASHHPVAARQRAHQLLDRLGENEDILRAFNRATQAMGAVRRITPAAEWLLDNFYLIEEQIQLARRHLPRGYSRELPQLRTGPSAGLPRVYDIGLELIAHVDAQIDAGALSAFVAAYQSVSTLKLGELWAIPIMLRLGLIENLQRITTRLIRARADSDLADHWVDRLQAMAERQPAHLVIVVADLARADLPSTSAFVAEFCLRLSRHSPVLHLARHWLEQHLAAQGLTIEQLVQQESQHQAEDQVSVSHSIASLRFLSALDWKEFVETLSRVEAILRTDPADVYGRMDFPTRDRYRHAVEALARHGRLAEDAVAREAVALAAAAAVQQGHDHRAAHVGYYLIGRGSARLARLAHVRWPWRDALERAIRRRPLACYAGGILSLTLLVGGGFAHLLRLCHLPAGWMVALGAAGLLGASQLAVALVNWLATLLVRPRLLPRLDFSAGLDPDCRAMVVVPTLLTRLEGVDGLLEKLELHHLANRDPHLYFALLTDFRDAPAEHRPDDAPMVQRARAGIERLNRKYAPADGARFFLFHRPRRWNAGERTWMGYERKRGKLMQFNARLRGGALDDFSEVVGDVSVLPAIRYVITLDTDTQLPREAARQLVATMAHPLNRPVFDEARGVVTEGYGILQPRVGVSLPGAGRSWFVRLFSGDAGIDPYTREVSDVYQDLFQEGSFIGKGVYDVDAFERALRGRCPENRVLSHDLLEACHARSGLVCDVELYEEFPARYNVDVDRRHRWIRGDWQLLPWLRARVPGEAARPAANPLSALSQWKLLDNLRRSLVPLALLAVLLGEWWLTPALASGGTLLVLTILLLPGLLALLAQALGKPRDLPWGVHLRVLAAAGGRSLGHAFLALAFLPYDAWVSLDAIGRTLLRLLVTRRRLLQWQTSGDSERTPHTGLSGFYATMWIVPLAALAGGALLVGRPPPDVLPALPLLGLWAAAPWLAWWISRPLEAAVPDLTSAQRLFLRRAARQTWHYFDTFVTAQENALPPDNVQEVPVLTIAARTSPTNIGLALLANLAAHDLGHLSLGGLAQRTRATLATLQRLERHRGHFFNWYDTRTLQPLLPRYVSSVDSGNLAGHLLTLGAGLREQADAPLFPPQLADGLYDTLGLLRGHAPAHAGLAQLDAEWVAAPPDLPNALAWLQRITAVANRAAAELASAGEPAAGWAQSLRRQCEAQLAELVQIAPAPAGLAPPSSAATLRFLAREPGPAGVRAAQRLQELEALAVQCDALADMDFTFLYDPTRHLFAIGYNVTERRRDTSYYDLLASEARLCGYVAIALGQVPQDHWFSLGRLLVAARGEPTLVSWSGSMFEYLMPLLVMPTYAGTLLDQTCRAAVQQQIAYGRARGVPWGISESGYQRTDAHLTYQYRAFGVPGLGLKRGLAEDLVVAPYASALALMVAPRAACENLQRLADEGRCGAYGFYEAIDYTRARLPPAETSSTVRAYMAHHQGMTLLALNHLLRGAPMPRRFLACPLLHAADLLLQERVPRATPSVLADDLTLEETRTPAAAGESALRVVRQPGAAAPEVHLLSNGRYHVVISSAGGGYSRWRDLAVTRWREDATRDGWGTFLYLRDPSSGAYWSSAFQPTAHATRGYEAIFTQARAEFRQQLAGLEVHTEISVSPEDDVEVRRVTVTNRGGSARTLELTSYAEIVLASAASDAAHPAFSNLFVVTEFLPAASALLATRRARAPDERPPWLLHLMVGAPDEVGEVSCETDRARFIGRGGSLARPAALRGPNSLSNTVGAVLDPIVALRRTLTVPARGSASVDVLLGMAETRTAVRALVDKYQSVRMADRARDLAWTHSQVTLHQLNATEAEAQLYGRLAGALVYADAARRAAPGVLRQNRRGQSGLWSYGISGDAPLVLLRIGDLEHIELVRQLIQAHSYWRMKGLTVDLVILHEDTSVYRDALPDRITGLISSGIEAQLLDKPGGIFVRRLEQIADADRLLLQCAARIVLEDDKGTLTQQLDHGPVMEPPPPLLGPYVRGGPVDPPVPLPPRELIFPNGCGGFTRDGHEYVITLQPGQNTPAPWVNVLANPWFGTLVSESGSAYTWAENAHEFRLTPWSNDPVQDPGGEALYLRDEQTGRCWSPTPGPARGATPYVIRHGFGYTVFEHIEHGIASELWIYVAMDAPVKFSVLKLRNVSGRPRRISVTGYWEWVLGDQRAKSLLHVQTEVDLKTGALLARNFYSDDFAGRTVFLDVHDDARTFTGDRREFIGRNGSLADPAALRRVRLSGKVGAGLDPCGALQVVVTLPDEQEREVCFRLGVGRDAADVQALIRRYRQPEAARAALEGVWAFWNRTLGAINVDTPDPAVNVLANGWLLYQTLGGRLWGRTGFYQSGGAFGFRDQLQDVMALVHAEPGLTRAHLLRAAGRQFKEGDVQHWWHPPTGRGVRTHVSDDFLWLPYATCRYVASVADTGVLDEPVPFLDGRAVRADQEAVYALPDRSEESATLYQHCVRAIERGQALGEHGLPLMGGGDWNDGMNRVGHAGRGESVWLGFFRYDVLTQFGALARARGDVTCADRCADEAAKLQANLERHGWDGAWYRRAFFDSGAVLGARGQAECQIDALPQSWAVISGAGDPSRARQALGEVDRRLVRRADGLIQLFDPPFDLSPQDPGYIKGYLPGVRENGGQYTHAAIWTALAFARLGDAGRAWELFDLLSPVHHGDTPERIARYRVEPYVVAADVYAVAPHTGRGGWTWYTGAAGWMYRLLVEELLGVQRAGDLLRIVPRLHPGWTAYKIHYRFGQTVYHITVQRRAASATGPCVRLLDGHPLDGDAIRLVDDRQEHAVEWPV